MESHIYNMRVYYQDTDAGGVVYHGRYANFAERARCEFLRENGQSVIDLEKNYFIIFVVKKMDFDFMKPAYLDDELTIKSYVVHIGKASFTMRQEIYCKDDKLVLANIVLVCVSGYKGIFKPQILPVSVKAILASYFQVV